VTDRPAWVTSRAQLEAAMASSGEPHAVGLEHGTMRMLLYAPRGTDDQQPHRKDEIYIITSGHAEFMRGEERVPVGEGDTIFVPAGMVHRFEAMSDTFATWVVFWGPQGGEA
jgi:mannose-6-phosphate isomerase-like protein (cupin superfamily)